MTIKQIEIAASMFTKKHFKVLGEFQNYGGGGKFKSLGRQLFTLPWPPKFQKVTSVLWRVMALEEKLVKAIQGGKSYQIDNVSSWSKSEKIAREFANENWFQDYVHDLLDAQKSPKVVLLKMKPTGEVLDIDALHRDSEFVATKDAFEDKGMFFNEGLDIGSAQQEVAVKSFLLTKSMIVTVAEPHSKL